MARDPRRRNEYTVPVYDAYNRSGWRVVKRIGWKEAGDLVRAGAARELCDALTGDVMGVEMGQPVATENGIPSLDVSDGSLSAFEMQVNAGLYGVSRTATMTEEQKVSRVHPKSGRVLAPEDVVERTREKIRIYREPLSAGKVVKG